MFTGIIQDLGAVTARTEIKEGVTFTVSAPGFSEKLGPGDSVSVSGVCQTVEEAVGNTFTFTAVGETLRLTTLGELDVDSPVNLERAATLETALGGHLVQGHVDGVATVESFERAGNDYLLAVRVPDEVFPYVVHKGSIAIDGVSLTAIDPKPGNIVTITIIPFTLEHTTMKHYRAGTRVNVEADVIGKYVHAYLSKIHGNESDREVKR